jgi:Tfp pilus assembly protein FimT
MPQRQQFTVLASPNFTGLVARQKLDALAEEIAGRDNNS